MKKGMEAAEWNPQNGESMETNFKGEQQKCGKRVTTARR
jgi:hypothetical protein